MHLSLMVQRHRLLSVPLMVALLVSWCLLLCSVPSAQAAQTHDAQQTQAHGHGSQTHEHERPAEAQQKPCHGDSSQAHGDQASMPECESCDTQPEPASGAGVSAMILSTLDWIQSLNAPPVSTSVVASLPPDPYPPPARLHLVKAVFLI